MPNTGIPRFRSTLQDGTPNAYGYVYTWQAGTSTPKDTYSDSGLLSANTWPVQLDANGEAWIFQDYYPYKMDVQTSGSVSLPGWPKDELVSSSVDTGTQLALDLANTTSASLGASLVGDRQFSSTNGQTQRNINKWQMNFFTYLSDAQVNDVLSGAMTYDMTALLQLAVDDAISLGHKLIIPAGTYKITAPLRLMKFVAGAYSFCSCSIEGEITPWNWATSGTAGQRTVVIRPTFNDRPAIIIQSARATSLKNIFVKGTNNISSILTVPANYYMMMDAATFNQDASRDSRYSPQCAFCVDPFGTSIPSDGGYPDMSSYYVASAAGSSDITFDHCVANDCVIGFMITPNPHTSNAENIMFMRCYSDYVKVGLAIGQNQSRNVSWTGGNSAFNYTCFDGVTYGKRQGYAPNIFGANCAGKYLFNVSTTSGEPNYINGLYAESFSSIGFFGAPGSDQTPVVFSGCSFQFSDFGNGSHADNHVIAYGPISFISCFFSTSASTYPGPIRIWNGNVSSYKFQSCCFKSSDTEPSLAPATGAIGIEWEGIYMENCTVTCGSRGGAQGKDSFSQTLETFDINRSGIPLLPFNSIVKLYGTANTLYFNGQTESENRISLGTLAIAKTTNGKATFTATDPNIVRTGDFIYAYVPGAVFEGPGGPGTFPQNMICVGIVVNIAGSVITVQGVPQSFVDGSYLLYIEFVSRLHLASTCTTSGSDAVLTSVTNPTNWKNGHRIKGSGIPVGSYIISGGGTSTITISKNTTTSASGVRIYDANLNSIAGTPV